MQNFWSGLDGRRRIIALLSAVAILAAIVGIGRVATAPSMVLLYSGLDPMAAGEVIGALEAQGATFEIRDSAIYVERTRRDRLRMDLAAQGLPAGGPSGYEILDGLSGFGTTSQMFDAAYWRAKEGELARTITATPDVQAARVHLASPVNQPFARTPEGSASVTVTMARNSLDAERAQAIRYLVASAVAGLEPDSVAVIDSARGVILAGQEDGLGTGPMVSPSDRAETIRANVQRLLEARVGVGRAIVEVNVDADMDSQTITERVVDPESRVAISSEVEESSENAQGGENGVTVASNLPDGDVQGEGSTSTRQANQIRERFNYEVSETRSERVILPGQVRRISVAVMVDGLTETAPDGTASWQPRPDEEIDTLRQLVETAIGFDASRGDTVTIESLQFVDMPEQGALVERSGDGFLARHGAQLAQIGVLAAVVLALIFFVLRPMMSRAPPAHIADLAGPSPELSSPTAAIQAAQESAADVLDLPPQSVTMIERLREVISDRSEESAAVLRSWIESPETQQEATRS